MLRALILLLLGAALSYLAWPFVLTSRALNERGITIAGRVYHKSETVRVVYSGWERMRDATIEYSIPETGGVSFFTVHPDVEQFDALHPNQAVEVRYLLRRDVPDFAIARFLWELHALPTVRAANLRETSKLDLFRTPGALLGWKLLGGAAVLLLFWRITRGKPFAWAAGAAVAAAVGLLLLQGFPRPTPAPSIDVRRASGHVKSIGEIDTLFSGSRERGATAEQPVDVVGVEFVPEGRAEPVVAVDLIDQGSVAGLHEQSTVTIVYERGSPRTAYIEGATRAFPKRNFSGIVVEGVLSLAVMIGLLMAAHWVGRVFPR